MVRKRRVWPDCIQRQTASEISYPILAPCSKTLAKHAVAWAAYLRSKEAGLFVVTRYIYTSYST